MLRLNPSRGGRMRSATSLMVVLALLLGWAPREQCVAGNRPGASDVDGGRAVATSCCAKHAQAAPTAATFAGGKGLGEQGGQPASEKAPRPVRSSCPQCVGVCCGMGALLAGPGRVTLTGSGE